MQVFLKYSRISATLIAVFMALSPAPGVSAETGASHQPGATPKGGINTLPPVGTGHQMVKPYRTQQPVSGKDVSNDSGAHKKESVSRPLSREIVPPGYRYGTPGYQPDGRGGRGYDFGYPGYRDQGGGGYPHQRPIR